VPTEGESNISQGYCNHDMIFYDSIDHCSRPPSSGQDNKITYNRDGEWDDNWDSAEDDRGGGKRVTWSMHDNNIDIDTGTEISDVDDRFDVSTVHTSHEIADGVYTGGFASLPSKADVASNLKRTERGRTIKRVHKINIREYEKYSRRSREDLLELSAMIFDDKSSSIWSNCPDSPVQCPFERMIYRSSSEGRQSGGIIGNHRPRIFQGPAAIVALAYLEIAILQHPVWGPGVYHGGLYGITKDGMEVAAKGAKHHRKGSLAFFEGSHLLNIFGLSSAPPSTEIGQALLRWIVYQAASHPSVLCPWVISILKRQYFLSLANTKRRGSSIMVLNVILWMSSLGSLLPVCEFLREILSIHCLHLTAPIVKAILEQLRSFVTDKILENTFLSYIVCETYFYYLDHYTKLLSREQKQSDREAKNYFRAVFKWAWHLYNVVDVNSNSSQSDALPGDRSLLGHERDRGNHYQPRRSSGLGTRRETTTKDRVTSSEASQLHHHTPVLNLNDRIEMVLRLRRSELQQRLKFIFEIIMTKIESIEDVV